MAKEYQDVGLEPHRGMPASVKDALAETWALVLTTVGVAAGMGQLAASGSGRVALAVISGVAFVFILGRLTVLLVAMPLRRQLQEKDREIAKYRATLRRVANPPQLTALYEDLLLVIEIGATADGDRVIERHKTTAQPSLLYRVIRPITAVDIERTTYAQLGLQARSLTDGIHISVLPLSEDTSGVWLMVLLHPQLSGQCEWEISYSTPLWNPLRSMGVDSLGWNPNLIRHRKYPAKLTRFELRFIFPRNASDATVREAGRRRGDLNYEELANGQRCITWKDTSPSEERYEWDVGASFQ